MNLSEDSSSDLFGLLCGAEIGRGEYRSVYQHRMDDKLVVKHDTCENWSNVHEFTLYRELQDTPLGKWLAPAYWLSPRGIWLIQAKTTPIEIGNYPKRVPAIFADLKPSNWGMFEGRPVCHDYGNNRVYTLAKVAGKVLQRVALEHHV